MADDAVIFLPGALARHIGNPTVIVPASTLGDALARLTARFELSDAILDAAGNLQPYLRIFVDDSPVKGCSAEELDGLDVRGRRLRLKTALACG